MAAYIGTGTIKEAGKAKEEATNWVDVSKEGDNEFGEAGEGCIYITPLFDQGNTVVL